MCDDTAITARFVSAAARSRGEPRVVEAAGSRVQLGSAQDEARELREALCRAHAAVLDRGVFREGPERDAFESELGVFMGAQHVVAVASGSAAMTVALKALGVGVGHEVLVAANIDISASAPIVHSGATPVLCDIDERTLNLDPRIIEQSIGSRTRAAIVVHMYGNPADLANVGTIATSRRIHLIEDASHAVGAEWAGRRCGTLGIVGVLSLSSGKPFGATGTAGAILTDDVDLAAELRMLANYGLEPGDLRAINLGQAFAQFRCRAEGYNASLDELQSATLRVKLRYLPTWIERRRRLREVYLGEFGDEPDIASQAQEAQAVPVLRHFAVTTSWRDHVVRCLTERGVDTSIGYFPPLHTQPFYAQLHPQIVRPQVTERVAGRLICLPLHPYLTEEDVRRVAQITLASVRAARDGSSAARGTN